MENIKDHFSQCMKQFDIECSKYKREFVEFTLIEFVLF